MKVHFFSRKSNSIFFSIEELFNTIQKGLYGKVDFENFFMPFHNSGFINRIKNISFAQRSEGNINHITGDINYLGIFLSRRNTILTIHDCGELDKQKGLKKLFLWLFWFYLPTKRLKYITVISQATKQHLLSYVNINPNKVLVIPNCLIGHYNPSQKSFNKGKPVILQVGVTPNKNIERLAAALQNISCTLKIIGKPSELQQKALHNNNIDYEYLAGLTREEVICEYDNCDIVAFVSLLEGFGLPIIEGQAMLKPVITSNISAMPETAGEGACLVNPNDVKEIRTGILKIINDDEYRKEIIEKGVVNQRRFSPEVVSKQYLELYKNIY